MIDRDLLKHSGEFRRALENHKYELTDDGGILFTEAKATASGVYYVDGDDVLAKNTLTVEGLAYLFDVGVKDASKLTGWYLAPYSNIYTPVPTLTAATFAATAGEITSPTTGYSETTRPAWTSGAITSSSPAAYVDNLASRATFTIVTPTTLTIQGAGLLSSNVKGATTGKLLSAAKFTNPVVKSNGDEFNLGYRVRLTAS